MTNAQGIVLGIVQGLTEYLPVSSSAHLVLVPHFLGWQISIKEAFIFDVLVQLGTLVGVLAYFFTPIKDIVKNVIHGVLIGKPFFNDTARLGWLVTLATFPAAAIGFLFRNEISRYFSSPHTSCYFLMITGVGLIVAEFAASSVKLYPSKKDAFAIGCAQSLALLPGISRSGATIAAGMVFGLSRKSAAQFSFLMSIPIMLGAASVASHDLYGDKELILKLALPLTFGFSSAAISGYLVISWFMAKLVQFRLTWFAAYCIALGLLGSLYFSFFP